MLRNAHIISAREARNTSDAEPPVLLYTAVLVVLVMLTMLFGLTMLYSTSSGLVGMTYFIKQILWGCVGISGALFVNVMGYRTLAAWSPLLVAMAVGLLIIADFCFPPIKGAYRWIKIPGVGNIQPSEFAKLALTLFMAKYCSEKMRYLNTISLSPKRGLLPAVAVTGLVLGLIFLGKDWGTTFLLACVVGVIMFVAGLRLRYFLLSTLAIPFILWYLAHHDKERLSRLTTFLDPEKYQASDGYQLWHSILAFGSGHWFGVGFGESRLKARYLPEAHTDFILAIVGEELGFIMLCAVIVFYLGILFCAVKITVFSKARMGTFLGAGITTMITLQAIVNVGVVTGAFPTKGMPAPFISYGGSNLVVCLIGVGLLVNVALDTIGIDPAVEIPVLGRFKSLIGRIVKVEA